MHVLVTGHTGFKGAWLTLLLIQRGHTVSGLALDPVPGSLFEAANLASLMQEDIRCDIRDSHAVHSHVTRLSPDIVIHLAAQPLVRASYAEPRTTFETNVMGTLSMLEAITQTSSVKGALMVTTDKVYRNTGQRSGYTEEDPLGNGDPYSASKAMADTLISSWTASFPVCPIATARAGNVIGGGDVSADRLLPDVIRAFKAGEHVRLRYPEAVRPWQHVLDCLSGYVLVMDALLDGWGHGAWNFGPDATALKSVQDATETAARLWPDSMGWLREGGDQAHEETFLALDSSKARRTLGWRDVLDFDSAIEWTVDWERRAAAGQSPRDITLEQISVFEALVRDSR